MSLPNREEFIKKLSEQKEIDMSEWDKDLYVCPRCNGAVKRDYSVMYATNPPKYRYFCKSGCGYAEFI